MVRAARELISELRADLLSAMAVPALSAGFTSGLGLLVAQIAFGSLIFSGALAPWSSQGIGLVLFGNFATCLIFALAGGFRGVIAGLSPALVIVMANIRSVDAGRGRGAVRHHGGRVDDLRAGDRRVLLPARTIPDHESGAFHPLPGDGGDSSPVSVRRSAWEPCR